MPSDGSPKPFREFTMIVYSTEAHTNRKAICLSSPKGFSALIKTKLQIARLWVSMAGEMTSVAGGPPSAEWKMWQLKTLLCSFCGIHTLSRLTWHFVFSGPRTKTCSYALNVIRLFEFILRFIVTAEIIMINKRANMERGERRRRRRERKNAKMRGEKSLSEDSSNRQQSDKQCIDFSGEDFFCVSRFSVTASDWKHEQLKGARTKVRRLTKGSVIDLPKSAHPMHRTAPPSTLKMRYFLPDIQCVLLHHIVFLRKKKFAEKKVLQKVKKKGTKNKTLSARFLSSHLPKHRREVQWQWLV